MKCCSAISCRLKALVGQGRPTSCEGYRVFTPLQRKDNSMNAIAWVKDQWAAALDWGKHNLVMVLIGGVLVLMLVVLVVR